MLDDHYFAYNTLKVKHKHIFFFFSFKLKVIFYNHSAVLKSYYIHMIFNFLKRLYPIVSQSLKYQHALQETGVPSLAWEDPLEEGTATHSSILA